MTRAQLAVGETILIHSGAGGVGAIGIQVASAIGTRVLTTSRPERHFVGQGIAAAHDQRRTVMMSVRSNWVMAGLKGSGDRRATARKDRKTRCRWVDMP